VGGISAYGVAMKKHKANELLHRASMLASTVSAQIMSGKDPTTLDTFADSNLGKFALDYDSTKTTFDLKISELDGSVCSQLKKGGMVQNVDCNPDAKTATITYYKNLATTEAEGEKSPTGGSGEGGGETGKLDPCADVTCEDGLTCFHGECKCPNGLFMCGDQCCAEGTYCSRGSGMTEYICVVPTSGCTKNSDCKDAEGNVDISKYCKFSYSNVCKPGTGTCTDKGTLTPYTLNLPSGALTVYKGDKMSWWSASNLCQAHGKQMVTMSDLGLADSGTNTACYFDKTWSFYATIPCICNGGSDSDCSATDAAIRTNTGALDIYDDLWLAEHSKSDACLARYVWLYRGSVVNDGRNNTNNYALCR
jgi:hypothetical protein